jgi:hypothetical protein
MLAKHRSDANGQAIGSRQGKTNERLRVTDRINVDCRTVSAALTNSTHAALQAELRLSSAGWPYDLSDAPAWNSPAQNLVKGSHARSQEAHGRLFCLHAV